MSSQEPVAPGIETLDPEACKALLERVIASPQLRRAARMREFLWFVGQRVLAGGSEQIPEQEIGAQVFGRQPGYDTSVDNIVRVNATDLRRRVDEYFATDGARELLIFEIPRGSYKPVFRKRAPTRRQQGPAKASVMLVEPQVSTAANTNSSVVMLSAATTLILALAFSCVVLWKQNRALLAPHYASSSTPALSSFWSPFLAARPNTDIILADTTFSLIEDITREPIPLDSYLSRNYINEIQSPSLSADRRADLALIAARNYGSLGDFHVAQLILQLDPLAKSLRLYYARDYTPPLIKQDSVILLGSRKSNPWVDLFANRLNFTIEYDPKKEISYIRNRKPSVGEPSIYIMPPGPDPTSGYSVVAYLPNPERNGKVLLVAGTGSEATESAGEFITSEQQLESFQQLLHVKTLPYFEVVLRTTHLNSTPMSAQVVAYRTYSSM
jgi:hypothetical protein